MGSYSGRIVFTAKTLSLWGQGKTLDATGEGRLFYGSGVDSSLVLHEVFLENGYGYAVRLY
jgi:hypothetical protein